MNWLSGNPDCDSGFKERILNYFDINRFTSEEFTTYVCKSSLYTDKCLLDVLGQKNILLSKRNNVLESHLSDIKKNIEDFEVEFENEKIFLMKIMTDFEEKH